MGASCLLAAESRWATKRCRADDPSPCPAVGSVLLCQIPPSDTDGLLWRVDLEGMDPHVVIRATVRSLSSHVLIDSRANLLELLERFRSRQTFLLALPPSPFARLEPR
jgi:hypothetical protein